MNPCNVTIDTDALLYNLSIIKKLAVNSKVVAMVKANAYGHGLIKIAKAIDGQVDYLCVARLSEAIKLRNCGLKSKILLAEGIFSVDELAEVCLHNLSMVVHEAWQVEALVSTKLKSEFDVWLKYDCGMHRLGFNELQFAKALKKLQACKSVAKDIKFITHFSCADHQDQLQTKSQYKKFQQIINDLPSYSISAANSASIIDFPISQNQYIRPGIMLYGSSPILHQDAKALGLKSVMTFSSEIISLRNCKAGEFVGYGATWQAKIATKIATVAAGYGDGYPRDVNTKAYVLIDGIQCPIVGRVSMDMLSVDVGHLSLVKIGQKVLLWGDELPVDLVSSFSNTISYDLLCRAGLNAYRHANLST